MTEQLTVPLSRLVASDAINARAATKEGLDEMAASILAKGIIQPLAVRPADAGDKLEIIDGRRRFQAMTRLVKDKAISRAFQVPVIIRNEDDQTALETSLMANTVRLPMHPVEQFEVFDRLLAEGAGVEDIAARFGIAAKTVRQQQALGRLAAEIREAWKKGRIDAPRARAFATHPDPEVQAATYARLKKQGEWALSEGSIRQALAGDRIKAGSGELLFVTEDAYLRRGGTISESLFEDDRYVDDPALLKVMVADKLAVACKALIKQGWAWAMSQDDRPNDSWSWEQLDPPNVEGKYDDDVVPDDWPKKQRTGAGVFITLHDDGTLCFDCGWIRPDILVASSDTRSARRPDDAGVPSHPAGSAPAESDATIENHATETLSGALAMTLSEVQTRAAVTTLAQDPALALRVLLAALRVRPWQSPAKITVGGMAAQRGVGAEAERDFESELQNAEIPIEALMRTLAPLIAASLDLRAHNHMSPRREAKALVAALDVEAYTEAVIDGFSALDYFKRSTKQTALDAIGEMMAAGLLQPNDLPAEGAAKAALYPHAAELATKHGWLPEFLRHPSRTSIR